MKTHALGNSFHIVWKYTLRAAKRLFPNGPEVTIRDFQDTLKRQKRKLETSFDLIDRYGLSPKVYLGNTQVTTRTDIATYLYDNAIHPRFFAEALHLIASKAKELETHVCRVQLRNLRRDSMGNAFKQRKIKEYDIGRNFMLFSKKPFQRKLEILENLGVLVLNPGSSLPTLSCSKATRTDGNPISSPQAQPDPKAERFARLPDIKHSNIEEPSEISSSENGGNARSGEQLVLPELE